MNLHSLREGIYFYTQIERIKEKQSKLFSLKDEIKKILEGHVEIPEEEVFAAFYQLEKLSSYLDKNVEDMYSHILKIDKKELLEYNEVVRSAHSIAERKGVETNWEVFKTQCETVLKNNPHELEKN